MEHVGIKFARGQLAKLQIALPRRLAVLLHLDLVHECTGLCQHVINIVEWRIINVLLLLPEATVLKECISLVVDVWLVHFLELSPLSSALLRGQLRMLVNDVLELIDHTAIRDECRRVLQMHSAIPIRIVF